MTKKVAIGIHVFLFVLIALPVHYYTLNRDKRDERFAWRMFSPVRSEVCSTQFFVEDRPVQASRHFHTAWVGIAQRGRREVISAMAQHLCQKNKGKSVRVRVQCEQEPRSTAHNRRILSDSNRSEDDELVEVVSIGAFDQCEIGAL